MLQRIILLVKNVRRLLKMKKRNKQDATLININALKKRVVKLEKKLSALLRSPNIERRKVSVSSKKKGR